MKYITLERMSITKVQLLRAALVDYKNGVVNLRDNFNFNLERKAELGIVINECYDLIRKLERELDEFHVDYTPTFGVKSIKK
jgi:hypothetical protein